MFLAPKNFLGRHAPQKIISDWDYEIEHTSKQNFVAIGPQSSEITRGGKKKNKFQQNISPLENYLFLAD